MSETRELTSAIPARIQPVDAAFDWSACTADDPQLLCELPVAMARSTVAAWVFLTGRQVVGYFGLIPGSDGFAHLTIYVIRSARVGGQGLELCQQVVRCLDAVARQQGLLAVGVNPTRWAQVRLCLMLGFADSGHPMPGRGPVMIRRYGDDRPAAEIATACFSEAFAMAAAVIAFDRALHGGRLTHPLFVRPLIERSEPEARRVEGPR